MYENLDVNRRISTPAFGSATGSFGMNTQPGGGNTPAMQAIDTSKLNAAANDSYIGQRLNSFSEIDPLLQYGVTIPSWILINQAMERYNKACRGDYGQSIIRHFGNFGDKVSNILFDNPIGRGLNKLVNGGKNLFKNVVYDNSALVRAFDKTASAPELGMVKTQMGGIKSMLSHDITNILDEYLKPLQCAKDFDSLNLPKSELQRIEQEAAKILGEANKTVFLQTEEFKLFNRGATQAQVNGFKNLGEEARIAKLRELKIKSLGFTSVAEFEAIKSAPEKNINRLMEILKNNKNQTARVSYSNKNLSSIIKGELGGRKVQFSELYNKMFADMGANHKTAIGKTLAKLSNYVLEGASSRISGGKLAALMQAYFLAEVLIRANRQEGAGNKFKSFMERFAELIGFFVFIGPSVKLMHKIGGLQYSGMTPQQVEAYRNAVKEFNEHVMNCDWTKAQYKQQRKILRSKFRPHTKNPFVYLARKVADVITVGLEQVRPYTKHKVQKVDLTITNIMSSPKQYFKNIPKRLADVMRNPKYWMKQMAGYPVRMIMPMLIFLPFMNKWLVKGVNKIFGKPTEGALADEGKEEEKQEALKTQAAAPQAQAMPQTPQVAPAAAAASVKQYTQQVPNESGAQISHTGLFGQKKQQEASTETQQKANSQPDIPKNRYIPSPEGVKVKSNKTSDDNVDKLLKRADKIEKTAIETLSMK